MYLINKRTTIPVKELSHTGMLVDWVPFINGCVKDAMAFFTHSNSIHDTFFAPDFFVVFSSVSVGDNNAV